MKKVLCVLTLAMLAFGGTVQAESKMKEKLKIVIPKFKLQNATIEEALVELRRLSRQQDPERQGINIIYVKPKEAQKEAAKKTKK